MGGIFTTPKPPPPPPPPPPLPDIDAEERQRRLEAVERRRRGRAGTIETSDKGVLTRVPSGASPSKKLFGE